MKKQNGMVNVEFLKSLMIVKNLSERQFAELVGVSHPQMNRIMNGKRGAGSKFIFGVLSQFPDVKYDQLFSSAKTLPKGNTVKKKNTA